MQPFYLPGSLAVSAQECGTGSKELCQPCFTMQQMVPSTADVEYHLQRHAQRPAVLSPQPITPQSGFLIESVMCREGRGVA